MTRRQTPAAPSGRGAGTLTNDGCCVEIYAVLPHAGEADVVSSALPPQVSILELGCGTGRIAETLAALGHRVVGVDSSAAMLAHLRRVEPVHAAVEDVALEERFDGVLLASTLVNTYDPARRLAMLRAARRHLAPGGVVVLQRLRPGPVPQPGTWCSGPVELELRDVVDHGGGCFSATVVHRLADLVAEQDFSSQVLDDVALDEALAAAGLRRSEVLTEDGQWIAAVAED